MNTIKPESTMLRKLLLLVLLSVPLHAMAQANAKVYSSCGSASYATFLGQPAAQTMDENGNLCTSTAGSSGGGSTVITTPLVVTTTDDSGTIASGGLAQTAIASNASRKAWCVQNPLSATETLNVRVNGTASATTGVSLAAGAQACNQPGTIDTAAISVFAATTGHAFTAQEKQ